MSKNKSWIPFAMFAGTTIVLTIPLFLIRSQRRSLSSRPTTTTAFAAVNFARPNSFASKPSQPLRLELKNTSSPDFDSPGPKELLSAVSRVDASTALFAGKAFGIATFIVTSSALTATWSVKTLLGIENTREFAHLARRAVQVYLPSLVSSIHKPHVDEEDGGIGVVVDEEGEWDPERSEKRLELAFKHGGLPLWTRTALVEMEQELRFEREKRERGSE